MKKIFLKIVSIFISCVAFVTLIGCNADNSDSSNHVHKYNRTVADLKYLKEDPTYMTSAVYYKSCACGAKGEETFVYGTPLKVYSEKEKVPYKPTSLTVSLYDAENSIYGFTYNTQSKPLRPVIQIKEGYSLAGAKTECNASVMEATCYNEEGSLQTYYIVKAEIPLEANKLYTYRAYDKYVNVGTDPAPLRTKDVKSTKFTFAHVSDSQTEVSDISGKGSGSYFADTLSMLSNNSDFIVHTGDFVEWARYEGYWKAMLDDNFSYLSKIPVMTISGNHETTYQGGTNETF